MNSSQYVGGADVARMRLAMISRKSDITKAGGMKNINGNIGNTSNGGKNIIWVNKWVWANINMFISIKIVKKKCIRNLYRMLIAWIFDSLCVIK